MRIRSIKPEFWRSDDIDALDWHHRLVFVGLWSYVDDNGVGLDRLPSICADLFAGDLEREPRETFARVADALDALAAQGMVQRYTVDGRAYLFITNWKKHQRVDRPNNPRYPLPTSDDAVSREALATSSREPRESPAAGAVEQGNRGAVEETRSSAPPTNPAPTPAPARSKPNDPPGFAEFWAIYPRRQGRGGAVKVWAKAVGKASVQEILDAAARYASDPNRDPQYTALPATWLNQERWGDDPLPARRGGTRASRAEENFARVEAMKDNPNQDLLAAFGQQQTGIGQPQLRAIPGRTA